MFKNSDVLITGGSGSWGTELTKQLLERGAEKIVILSRGELAQVVMRRKFNDPRIHFVIGDVRDYSAVDRLLANHKIDYIFHMAALKHVDVCENHPQEAIKTNIQGTTNVVNAAIKYKVKKVIDVSTDKACLDYFQTVELSDGTKRNIRDVVVNKEKVEVKSWDGNKFVNKKVINWFKNKLSGRGMYRLRYDNAPIFGKKQASIIVTEDHPVLTTEGWCAAMDLNTGDKVYTNEVLFNKKQRAFLLGTLLGDATIVKRNKGYTRASLKVSQCKKQEEWVKLKHKCVRDVANKICEYSNNVPRQPSIVFTTSSNLYLSELHRLCYNEDSVKRIPRELVKDYLYDDEIVGIFLASLFMDDGCITDNLIRIATHSFTKEDVDWFSTELSSLGYTCYTYGCDVGYKTYPELRFRSAGTLKLAKLLSPYIINTMRYKLPKEVVNEPYIEGLWEMGPTDYLVDSITLETYEYKTSRDVYCIDVEDTHNFVSGGIVVHNCSPTNLYGYTKSVGEKLCIQANNLTKDTDFVCIRGGNVLGSNGSVVPLFIDQINNSNEITVTVGTMTRYFLTLPEAIHLLFHASENSVGGETYVMNMPSFHINTLAEVLIKHYGDENTRIKEIGIREGEKLDELLVSEHEAPRTYVYDENYYIIKPELNIDRDYSHLDNMSKATFKQFSSADNPETADFLHELLTKGGFLL